MLESSWGKGDVVSRKVGKNISGILPENIPRDSNLTFSTRGILRGGLLPDDAKEGTIQLSGTIGERSQFSVTVEKTLELKYTDETGEQVERTVQITFFRTDEHKLDKLDVFEYFVQTRIVELGSTKTNAFTVTIDEVDNDRFLGEEEATAALVLAEIIANKKAMEYPDHSQRMNHAGSLATLGSIDSAIGNKRLRFGTWKLDWEELDRLLGPDADTVVSKTNIETSIPEQRKKAAEKGLDFLEDVSAPGEEDSATKLAESLDDLLSSTVNDDFGYDDHIIQRTRADVLQQHNTYSNLVDSFPNEFTEAMSNMNFGDAKQVPESATELRKMVLLYALHELYDGILSLLDGQDSIMDTSIAITTFGNGIAASDTEMAEKSLEKASDAYVDMTTHLTQEAKQTLKDVRFILEFFGLLNEFNRYLSTKDDLAGDSIQYYENALEDLVEEARAQHERAEKAREVFYIYTQL